MSAPLRPSDFPTAFTAADLMRATFTDPTWAVEGLVPEGVTLLVGASKTGKSWMSLGFAVAVARGGPALGSIEVTAGDVLYCALEDNARRLQDRLRRVLGDEPLPERLHFRTAIGTGADAMANISAWLDAYPDARLVIIDVLAMIRPDSDTSGKGSAYTADYKTIRAIKQVADRHQVGIMLVHHTRKMGDDGDVFNMISGSTGLMGASDASIILDRPRGENEGTLSLTGRDVRERQYAVRLTDDCHWVLTDLPPEVVGAGGDQRKILEHLHDHPGDGPSAIAAATGISISSAKMGVRRLVDAGKLDTIGRGQYFLPAPKLPLGEPGADRVVRALTPLDDGQPVPDYIPEDWRH